MCTSLGERGHIWAQAQEYGDDLNQKQLNTYDSGATAVPDQEPNWDYQSKSPDHSKWDHMLSCLIEGMKQANTKPADYYKVQEVTQGTDENPAIFLFRLWEAFHLYSNGDQILGRASLS